MPDFSHDNDDVPFLVSGLGVAVSLDNLVQRIATVDDSPKFSGLDKALEERLILGSPTRHSAKDSCGARDGSPLFLKSAAQHRQYVSGPAHQDVATAMLERFHAARETALAHGVEDNIV